MDSPNKVNVTIAIDANVLEIVHDLAKRLGMSFEDCLNRLLREHIVLRSIDSVGMDGMEREVVSLEHLAGS